MRPVQRRRRKSLEPRPPAARRRDVRRWGEQAAGVTCRVCRAAERADYNMCPCRAPYNRTMLAALLTVVLAAPARRSGRGGHRDQPRPVALRRAAPLERPHARRRHRRNGVRRPRRRHRRGQRHRRVRRAAPPRSAALRARPPAAWPPPVPPRPPPPMTMPRACCSGATWSGASARRRRASWPRPRSCPPSTPGRWRGFTLTRVPEGSLLTEAGLRAGDVLTQINDTPITAWPR